MILSLFLLLIILLIIVLSRDNYSKSFFSIAPFALFIYLTFQFIDFKLFLSQFFRVKLRYQVIQALSTGFFSAIFDGRRVWSNYKLLAFKHHLLKEACLSYSKRRISRCSVHWEIFELRFLHYHKCMCMGDELFSWYHRAIFQASQDYLKQFYTLQSNQHLLTPTQLSDHLKI